MRLSDVVNGFRKVFGSEPQVIASAPARLDLLNTHQDYKGLPVVGAAIELRCFVAARESGSGLVEVFSENMRLRGEPHRDSFTPLKCSIEPRWFGSYIRAAYVAMHRILGVDPPPARIYIVSEIPPGAGLGSSAALTLATVLALAGLSGVDIDERTLAEVGYVAEHDVMGIPCGRLDQYTSAFGGMLLIETRPPHRVERLDPPSGVFIAIDSGEKHETRAVHTTRQREIEEGLRSLLSMPDLPQSLREKLGESCWSTKWSELDLEELRPYLSRLSEAPRRRIEYTIRCHRSTMVVVKLFRGEPLDPEEAARALEMSVEEVEEMLRSRDPKLALLSRAMNLQHELLRDLYEVSTPRLEELRNTALGAGALACKISGAGLGGALTAVARDAESAENVATKCLELGSPFAEPVKLGSGARLEIF